MDNITRIMLPQVYWGRELLANVLPQNNHYRHTNGPVEFGPYFNQSDYKSITDCSGFVNALLEHSYGLPTNWLGVPRPYASTYYNAIMDGNHFQPIYDIRTAKIGDFVAMKYPKESDNTGHIGMINEIPSLLTADIWKVTLLDQSGGHGSMDPRNINNHPGLGIGSIQIHTQNGMLIGYQWSLSPTSQYIDITERGIAIGRYVD